MKYRRLAIGSVFVIILAISYYLSGLGLASITSATKIATQVSLIQTTQAKNNRDIKSLLALQLASQARSINIQENSSQMIGVLLAVQSMKMLPTIDAAQVLQSNQSAREIFHMEQAGSISSAAFSPDGRYIAIGSANNTSRVWEVNTGQEISGMDSTGWKGLTSTVWFDIPVDKNFTGKTCSASVTSEAASPDGKYVAVGCKAISPVPSYPYNPYDESVTIRVLQASADGGYSFMPKILFSHTVNSIAFSPNSKYLLTGSEDHTARVWDISTGREISRMTHDDSVTSIAFSPDGKQVMSSSMDHTVRVWETLPWRENIHGSNTGFVSEIAFSPDGKYIASGGRDGTILVQEMVTGREVTSMKLGGKNPSKDSSANPQIYWTSQGDENKVNSIAYSPDGKYIVSGSADNTVRIWDSENGYEIARMLPGYNKVIQSGHTYYMSGVNSVAFSPDGKYVASGGTDGNIYIWDVSSKQEVARMTSVLKNDMGPYTNYDVLSVAFSPDGKYVVSGNMDNTVRIWDLATKQEVARPSLYSSERFSPAGVRSVAFSPDDRYVVWGGDNTIHVWDTVKKQETLHMNHDHFDYSIEGGIYSLEDSEKSSYGWVSSVAYSYDGKYILSASADNTVRIWDAVTGQEISRIVHNEAFTSSGGVYSVAISPDGKYVASVDSNGQIDLWLWRPDDLIADACSRLPRNLTPTEWTKYIGDVLPYQAVCPNLPIDKKGEAQP
jgi:WD40 repeat protein